MPLYATVHRNSRSSNNCQIFPSDYCISALNAHPDYKVVHVKNRTVWLHWMNYQCICKVSRIHLLGTMNFLTTFQYVSPNICWETAICSKVADWLTEWQTITVVFFCQKSVHMFFLPTAITFWDLSSLSLLINSYFLIFYLLSCGGTSRCLNLVPVSSRLGGTWCPLCMSSWWMGVRLCCWRIHCVATDHNATWARPLHLNVCASWRFFPEYGSSHTVFPDGSNKMFSVLFILCALPQPVLLSLITLQPKHNVPRYPSPFCIF